MNISSQAHSKKIFSVFIGVAICALLLSACTKKPSEAIIGKWRDVKDNSVLDFRADGTLSNTQGSQTMNGTYKFDTDSHMVAQMSMPLPPEAKEKMPPGTPDSIAISADCIVTIKGDDMDINATLTMTGMGTQKDVSHFKREK